MLARTMKGPAPRQKCRTLNEKEQQEQYTMSTNSAAYHEPRDLTYLSGDEVHGTVTFTADSQSNPGATHYSTLDVLTGSVACTCVASAHGRECWHMTLAQSAWDGQPPVIYVAQLTDAQLCAYGKRAAAMVAQYRAQGGNPLADDVATLLACRAAWRDRQ